MDSPLFSKTRRHLLQSSVGVVAANNGLMCALGALTSRSAMAAIGKQTSLADSPYGPVAPVADWSTGLPLLALPEGFEYRSYGWTGDPMADGHPTPGAHDGMAVVASRRGGAESVIVRNHERGLVKNKADVIHAAERYSTSAVDGVITIFHGSLPIRIGIDAAGEFVIVTDPRLPDPPHFVGYAGGGTTSLRFRNNNWISSVPSLGGTVANCAGGGTPWGTWLSCEETMVDFSKIGGKKHGYVFEVAAHADSSVARPIVSMGRFIHEAVAFDPATGDVYETEDHRNLSALYRFRPRNAAGGRGSLHHGGKLQAARINSIVHCAGATTPAQANNTGLLNPNIGDEYVIEWVDIADPDAGPAVVLNQPDIDSPTLCSGPTYQALSKGCARMSRAEGIAYSNRRVFIVDTSAGVNEAGELGHGDGAVWELNLATRHLRAVFVSGASIAGNNPDNATIGPRGGLVLCEDGGLGNAGGSRLLGLNEAGKAYMFCRNNVLLCADEIGAAGKIIPAGDYRRYEFAGACFDQKGHVLFVNILTPGITFAIKGPWKRGNL